MNIMVHELVLTTGFQFMHTFQRHGPTRRFRWFFFSSTILTTIDLVFGNTMTIIGADSCPALQQAILASQPRRLPIVLLAYVPSVIFTVLDFFAWVIDNSRNKGLPRHLHTRIILPFWLTWSESTWNKKRIVFCTLGCCWWLLSIVILEVCVIGYFHRYVRQFSGTTGIYSDEDQWGYGQFLAFFSAFAIFIVAIRNWFLEAMEPYARSSSEDANSPGASLLAPKSYSTGFSTVGAEQRLSKIKSLLLRLYNVLGSADSRPGSHLSEVPQRQNDV